MGRVNSTSLFTFDSKKCVCSVFATDNKGKCCNDEHEIFKIEDDHAASQALSITPEFFVVGEIFTPVLLIESRQEFLIGFDESPPPPDPVPLFTKHCSLVFYDSMMS